MKPNHSPGPTRQNPIKEVRNQIKGPYTYPKDYRAHRVRNFHFWVVSINVLRV